MAASGPIYTANSPIPVDLFVSKKYPGLTRGDIGFADSSGGIIYRVNRTQHQSKSNSSQRRKRVVVVDSAGNPLISVYRQDVKAFSFLFSPIFFIKFNFFKLSN